MMKLLLINIYDRYNLIDMDKNYSRYGIPAVNKILPSEDIAHIMERLNDSIQTYWPCTTCFIFGKVFGQTCLSISLKINNNYTIFS